MMVVYIERVGNFWFNYLLSPCPVKLSPGSTSGDYHDHLPPRISINYEPHSSVSVQSVTVLMSSSQHARGLSLFLVPHNIAPCKYCVNKLRTCILQ